MFLKGSRYEETPPFTAEEEISPTFEGIRPRKIGRATGVLEHTISAGERLDLLALHYYNDSRRWWRILDANPTILYGGDLSLKENEGMVILIPRAEEPGEE